MTPRLRFPDFTDEWRAKRLGDVGSNIIGLTYSPKDVSNNEQGIVVLRSSNIKDHGMNLNDIVRVKNGTNIKHNQYIQDGDILICTRNGSQRLIGKCYQLFNFEGFSFGAFMSVFRSSQNDFVLMLFNTEAYKKQIQKDLGARINQITTKQLNKYTFYFPSELEQKKIVTFLRLVDERIKANENKLELLQQYKKGVMQKIFTQQIRFKDENGVAYPDWEEKRLGDALTEMSETNNGQIRMLSVTIKNGVVPFDSIDRKDNSNSDKSKYKAVRAGDIAYNSMRMWQGASGVSKYNGIVSPAYTVVRTNKQDNPYFWGYYFKLTIMIQTFERHSQGLTSDTWNLKYPTLSKIKVKAPIFEEQQKIANFLIALDNKIKAEQTRLAAAKQWKKGLLQRMFV